MTIVAVDLFCGAGGLTRGLLDAGVLVAAGVDIDPACRFSYESNGVRFIQSDVGALDIETLRSCWPKDCIRLLAGCAPCQPFSAYTRKRGLDERWALLSVFLEKATELLPDLITMENVSGLFRHAVFDAFVVGLRRAGYYVDARQVDCTRVGVPQKRIRLVLLASRLGPVEAVFPVTPAPTVRETIGHLPPIAAGVGHHSDPIHAASGLSATNLARIVAARPGGTWREWPAELIAACHRKPSGRTFPSVYGRMSWDEPSPTITTQFHGFGNGRFGHPEQNRALSLREGALLQSFSADYPLVESGTPPLFSVLGRLIGNAVPPLLGKAIGKKLVEHIEDKA